jgi:hypothetical protein
MTQRNDRTYSANVLRGARLFPLTRRGVAAAIALGVALPAVAAVRFRRRIITGFICRSL